MENDMEKDMEKLVEILHQGDYSLALFTPGNGSYKENDTSAFSHTALQTFDGRGVSDLYRIYTTTPAMLKNAMIADKVVGKGAAALMILGGVSKLHADVISKPALSLLKEAGVQVSYANLADNIINRQKNGICPVEALCLEAPSAEECLPKITKFLNPNASFLNPNA